MQYTKNILIKSLVLIRNLEFEDNNDRGIKNRDQNIYSSLVSIIKHKERRKYSLLLFIAAKCYRGTIFRPAKKVAKILPPGTSRKPFAAIQRGFTIPFSIWAPEGVSKKKQLIFSSWKQGKAWTQWITLPISFFIERTFFSHLKQRSPPID